MLRVLPHLVHHLAVDEFDPAGIFQRTRLDDPLVLVDGDPVEWRRPGGGDETVGRVVVAVDMGFAPSPEWGRGFCPDSHPVRSGRGPQDRLPPDGPRWVFPREIPLISRASTEHPAGRAGRHRPGPRPLRPRRPGPDPGDEASPGRTGSPARLTDGPRCPNRAGGDAMPSLSGCLWTVHARCHGPAGSHRHSNPSPFAAAISGGPRNPTSSPTTCPRSPALPSRPLRLTNAFHCTSFAPSLAKASPRAIGSSVGTAVPRRRNVATIASRRTGPWNANDRPRTARSKKSFIRLLAIPNFTSASSFSATTVSRG